MKSNVDLTENQLFSRHIALGSASTLLRRILKGKYPWSQYSFKTESDTEFGNQRERLVVVGSKVDRQNVKERRQMDSLEYCDCCGEFMNQHPWDKQIGVCKLCNERFESRKLGWIFTPERERRVLDRFD